MKSARSRLLSAIVPSSAYFILWWTASLLIFLIFDILWCIDSGSFRPFTAYKTLYVFLFAATTLFSMPSVFTKKPWLQFGLLMALSLLLCANLMYARTYFCAIPLQSYAQAANLAGFGGSIVDSFRWSYLFVFMPPVAALIVDRRLLRRRTLPSALAYLLVLALSLLLCWSFLAGRGGFRQRMEQMSTNANDLNAIPPVFTVFVYLAYDYMVSNSPLSADDERMVADWFASHKAFADAAGPDSTLRSLPASPRSCVVILCESLESWPVGLKVDGVEVSPVLGALVADSAVYYNPCVLTQTRNGRSIDGQLVYLAGRHPMLKGIWSRTHTADAEYPSLPKALAGAVGAKSFLLTPDRRHVWNQDGVANALGFDARFYSDSWGTPSEEELTIDSYLSDSAFFARSCAEIAGAWPEGEPAFAMWVTHTGHNPFNLLKPSQKLAEFPGVENELVRDFLVTANYVDNSLGVILGYLASRSDFDDMLIVILGDHEGLAGHRAEICADPAYSYVSSLPFTPMIMIHGPRGGLDSRVIGQVDVYSAILDALGLYESYPWQGMGLSPFRAGHPGAAFSFLGEMEGEPVDTLTAGHLQRAPEVSDLLFRHPALAESEKVSKFMR